MWAKYVSAKPQLNSSLTFLWQSHILFMLNLLFLSSQRCAYGLLRFRLKNHLLMVQKTSWLNLRRPTWFGGHKDGLRWFAFPVACSNATSIFSSKSVCMHIMWRWCAKFVTDVILGLIFDLKIHSLHPFYPGDWADGRVFTRWRALSVTCFKLPAGLETGQKPAYILPDQ